MPVIVMRALQCIDNAGEPAITPCYTHFTENAHYVSLPRVELIAANLSI